MKKSIVVLILLLANVACYAQKTVPSFKVEDLSAWCIIDFDAKERTPEQRIVMLQELGITKYGFEKGKGDLSKMKHEFQLASESNIEIVSIFLWLNAKRDSIGKLSPNNQQLLANLKETQQKPAVWLSFSNNFFEDRTQKESIVLATEMIRFIKPRMDSLDCKLALYNHHGWFGNPHNQLEVLEKLGQNDIGLVYNFHHAQEYVEEFPEIVKKIVPYLSHVNVNGVKKKGPQILTIGDGDYEFNMIQQLLDAGYKGTWGILGHIKTEDVKLVLERNIAGLQKFKATN